MGRIDILTLIGRDTHLRRVASTHGGEYAGPCPFCGGRDRFRVWPERDRWWCRQCEKSGDAIAYQVERGEMTPQEAGRERGSAEPHAKPANPAPAVAQEAPRPTWEPAAALAVVRECERDLRAEVGEKARAWLTGRGIREETARTWRLGYNPRKRSIAGLIVPRGVVLPCFVGDLVQYVKVRRPVPPLPPPKYQQVKGSKAAIFGLDHLDGKRVAVICEGELDAVLLWQEAGDLVDVVAVGAKTAKPALPFLAHLAGAARWLVALDRDADSAADWWGEFSARVRRVRPLQGNDLTDFAQAGGDLRAWVTYHLERLGTGDEPALDVLALRAQLDTMLIEMRGATGCPDAGAERLLARWKRLEARYSGAIARAMRFA